MLNESDGHDALAPNAEAALGHIEEWAAILAVELGVNVTAKLLRQIAVELESLPGETLQ